MNNAQVLAIADRWKADGFNSNIELNDKTGIAEVISMCVARMYPTAETYRNVLILCESDKDYFVNLFTALIPNITNLTGRGLTIYSSATFTRLAHIPDFNCCFVIRSTIGWNAAEELAIGSSKFKLRITYNEDAKTTTASTVEGHFAPPVEKGEPAPPKQPSVVIPLKLSVPVHEVRYAIDLSPEDRQDYDTFSKYLEATYAIFGSQRNMERAYMGDYKNGMSAEKVCTDIAEANGWSTHLDMTQTGNRFIDETYSPMALKERIKITYNYGRARAKLVSDNASKIPVIADIIESYEGGCLILSKGEEFTNKIVKDLNVHFNREVVLPFHDAIPSISVKGKNGKMKPYGARSQSKDNLADFHCGRIWALAAKGGSLWKDIPFIAKVVIITSPLACDLQSITKRCIESTFGDVTGVSLFKLFINDTIEENVVLRQADAPDYEQIGGVKRESVAGDNTTVFLNF
jgi:hypothetical protein